MESKHIINILLIISILLFSSSLILAKELSDEKKLSEAYEKQATFTNDLYEAHMLSQTSCTPMGFCIGDKVAANEKALRLGVNFSGTIVNVQDKLLIIDMFETDETKYIHETYLRHLYNPQLSELTALVYSEIVKDLTIKYSEIYKTEVTLTNYSFNPDIQTGTATFTLENESYIQEFTTHDLLEIMKYKDYTQINEENQ